MNKLFIMLVFLFNLLQTLQVNGQEYRVTIRHWLPKNDTLTFRCQSKDDDLGNHTLNTIGTEYHWDFGLNIWGTTLFFCHFYWGTKQNVFDVFNSDIAVHYCGDTYSRNECLWQVSEDGFSILEFEGFTMLHDWGASHSLPFKPLPKLRE